MRSIWPAELLISSARRSVSTEWIRRDDGQDLADLVALEMADHVPVDLLGQGGVIGHAAAGTRPTWAATFFNCCTRFSPR